jgi:hypothetical protein
LKRWRRIAVFGLGYAFATSATLLGIRTALDGAEIEAVVVTRHDVARYYRDRVEAYRTYDNQKFDYRAVLLGDSMVVSYPQALQIADTIQRRVRRLLPDGPRVGVVNLGLAGTGPFDYYFTVDVISRLEPDLVIIEFNLASASDNFYDAFSRPELSGWLEGTKILESAWLPMSRIGLTFDRLLLYNAIIRAGAFESWVSLNQEQVRFEQARANLEEQLAFREATGLTPEESSRQRSKIWLLARNSIRGVDRHSKFATRASLGASLDGLDPQDPTLVMLGATVRSYKSRGIDVLVYVNPINVEHIEQLGILDESRLAQSLDHATAAVTSNGGHLVDLHQIFPDAAFRDRSGHFAYQGEINGPVALAEKLAPSVVALVKNARRDGI